MLESDTEVPFTLKYNFEKLYDNNRAKHGSTGTLLPAFTFGIFTSSHHPIITHPCFFPSLIVVVGLFFTHNNSKACGSALHESLYHCFFLTNTIHFMSCPLQGWTFLKPFFVFFDHLFIDVMGWRILSSGVRATECEDWKENVTEIVVNVIQHVTFRLPNNIFHLIIHETRHTQVGEKDHYFLIYFIVLFWGFGIYLHLRLWLQNSSTNDPVFCLRTQRLLRNLMWYTDMTRTEYAFIFVLLIWPLTKNYASVLHLTYMHMLIRFLGHKIPYPSSFQLIILRRNLL